MRVEPTEFADGLNVVREREMASKMTLPFLARTTRGMKLSLSEVGKAARGTGLVLNILSCLLEST